MIRLNWTTATTGFARGVTVHGIQMVLNAPDIPEPPQWVALPQPTETLEGGTVVLNVTATGEGLTYQWRKGNMNLSDGGSISGAKSPELTIRRFTAGDTGFYSVLVQNEGGTASTEAVKVKVVEADRTITGSLVAHFKFDQTSGDNVVNSGSDAINGNTIFSTPLWAAGKIGNAYEDGSGGIDGILVPNYTKITEEMTASAWVKVNAIGNSDYQIVRNASGNLYTASSGGVSPPIGQFEFDLDFVSGTVMNLRAQVCAGVNVYTVRELGAFPVGEWQHVAFTADGGQVRLYRNGQLVATTRDLDAINQPNVPWLSIGARMLTNSVGVVDVDLDGAPPNAGPQVLNGQLDDLGIWRTAWPQSVIQSIYEKGNAGQNLTAAELPELPPVPTDITLSLGVGVDGSVSISWEPAGGTLEMSTDIGGGWTPVAGNPNPYTIAAPTGNAYFRVKGN